MLGRGYPTVNARRIRGVAPPETEHGPNSAGALALTVGRLLVVPARNAAVSTVARQACLAGRFQGAPRSSLPLEPRRVRRAELGGRPLEGWVERDLDALDPRERGEPVPGAAQERKAHQAGGLGEREQHIHPRPFVANVDSTHEPHVHKPRRLAGRTAAGIDDLVERRAHVGPADHAAAPARLHIGASTSRRANSSPSISSLMASMSSPRMRAWFSPRMARLISGVSSGIP